LNNKCNPTQKERPNPEKIAQTFFGGLYPPFGSYPPFRGRGDTGGPPLYGWYGGGEGGLAPPVS